MDPAIKRITAIGIRKTYRVGPKLENLKPPPYIPNPEPQIQPNIPENAQAVWLYGFSGASTSPRAQASAKVFSWA